jgi:hypothetical protein
MTDIRKKECHYFSTVYFNWQHDKLQVIQLIGGLNTFSYPEIFIQRHVCRLRLVEQI